MNNIGYTLEVKPEYEILRLALKGKSDLFIASVPSDIEVVLLEYSGVSFSKRHSTDFLMASNYCHKRGTLTVKFATTVRNPLLWVKYKHLPKIETVESYSDFTVKRLKAKQGLKSQLGYPNCKPTKIRLKNGGSSHTDNPSWNECLKRSRMMKDDTGQSFKFEIERDNVYLSQFHKRVLVCTLVKTYKRNKLVKLEVIYRIPLTQENETILEKLEKFLKLVK